MAKRDGHNYFDLAILTFDLSTLQVTRGAQVIFPQIMKITEPLIR